MVTGAVFAALIGAVGSLAIALLSLATSRRAREAALAAEARFKRSEEVRARTLEAGESVLGAIGESLIMLEALRLYLDRGMEMTERVVVELAGKAAQASAAATRSVFRASPYLANAHTEQVLSVLAVTRREVLLDSNILDKQITSTRTAFNEVAESFRMTAGVENNGRPIT